MADDVGNKSKAATTGEQASQMLGCGCLVLFVSFAGPIITNWLGLSPWPVAIAFALALAVAWFSSANPFPFPRAFLVSILAIGAIGGYAFGGKVEEDNAKVAAAPTTAPASSPAPTPTIDATPVPVRKEIVRITIDEIQEKFAKNQIAGAQFFETRTALIPGVAVRVREALGTGILIVKSPKTGLEMEIGFNEHGTRQLGEVEPKDRIEATCPSIHEAMGQVIIACDGIAVQPPR